jgi:hypothetical protein
MSHLGHQLEPAENYIKQQLLDQEIQRCTQKVENNIKDVLKE